MDLVEQLRLRDPHEARAIELERAGDVHRANRIRKCGRNDKRSLRGWRGRHPCRDRQCPTCCKSDTNRKAHQIKDAIARMSRPQHWVAHVLSRPCSRYDRESAAVALQDAVDIAKQSFTTLRGGRLFRRHVRGGVAVLEAVYNEAMKSFDVHFHIVLDAAGLPEEAANEAWKLLVGRGSLTKDPATVEEPSRIAFYICKVNSWAPDPSEVTPAELSARHRAFRGRKRATVWGTARSRPRKQATVDHMVPSVPTRGTDPDLRS